MANQSNQQQTDQGNKGSQGSGNNFKDNPEKAREAGRKGGEHSHGGGNQESHPKKSDNE